MRSGHRVLPWAACALSGLFIIVAFEPVAWWWCGWVALAPAWVALRGSAAVRKSPLRYGYLVGLMFIVGCFWWVGAATLAGIAIMALVLSFYPALWFLLVVRVARVTGERRPLSSRELAGGALWAGVFWVTLEWLRSWFMKGFNWNELGVSQVPSLYFRQLAALGGVPLLSLVLAVVGVLAGEAAWSAWHRWWRAAARAALATALVLALSLGYGWQRVQRHAEDVPRDSITYACIQPNIPEIPYDSGNRAEISQKEVEAMQAQQDLSAQAIRDRPALLIWPEAVTMQRLGEGRLIDEAIDHIEAYYHGSILLGSEEYVGGKVYNTAFLLGPDRSSLQRYRKVYLVVLGEYIPWADIFPWLTQWWGRGISATAGTEPGHLALAREGLSIAPLMCFEDTQPQVVNAAAARGPDFLVTMINAGWYSGRLANWCLRQHLENATLRCVEHDRPMLRCGDTGISCAIDADGRVVAMLPEQAGDPLEVRGILSGRLFLYPWESTLYERWGDWVGALCRWGTLGVGVAWLVRVRKKWFRERNQIGN